MSKKISFDNLPAAIGKILDILSSEGSEHAALPELVQRMALLEKKIDRLEKLLSPDRPVMDMAAVCRVLKLRPKVVNTLATSGVLPSHAEGRKTLFYEADVVKFHMNQPAWKEAVAASAPAEPVEVESESREPAAPLDIPAGGRHRVDIHAAGVILDRSTGAVRQLLSKIPHYKDGRRIYFYTDELREWVKTNRPLKRKPKTP
jgi:hypothetical protein